MTSRFLLAISTSSGVARVAAAAEPLSPLDLAGELFSFEITDYKSQSAQLLPLIQAHFQKVGLKSTECVAIAVDIGPGGFTSLRTACGVAQGLAVAWKVPTVPLSSFECMLPLPLPTRPVTVLMDARLNEIYAATLERLPCGTQWVQPPHLLPISILQTLEGEVVCDSQLFAQITLASDSVKQGEVSAVRLGQLAWQEFAAGRVAGAIDCQPLYVRDKVAQTTTERLALKHGVI
jgi:tRNA threonylcarbamoyladenosine biosynthesis protein TsaB